MRKVFCLLLFFIFNVNSFGSPLIFKVSKEINSPRDYVEIATFDATKYKQIRVGVHFKQKEKSEVRSFAFYSFEDGTEIFLTGKPLDEIWKEVLNSSDYLIDSPPSKVRLKGNGIGVYKVFVWGSL